MSQGFQVTCAIPRAGRTLKNFLNQLKRLGADAGEVDAILEVISASKARSGPDLAAVQGFLLEASRRAPACFGVFVDRKRAPRPYRVGFLGHEWDIAGIRLRVEGDEPHNGSSLIKLDEVDFTVVGLDELLSMTQYYLDDPTIVNKWGMYNYHLARPTGIRVAGSAMLTSHNRVLGGEVQDMVGFFLISNPGRQRTKTNLENLANYGRNVFVKGRYAGIVMAAYPGLKTVSVEDVEDAVLAGGPGTVGIEIVQSGNTLREKGLLAHGAPLFLSESLYVVDYDRYRTNPNLRALIQALNPAGYFDPERVRQFARWFYALERNLGDNWVDRPEVGRLFCEPEDPARGLRPYRLETRHWRPDDDYLVGDALERVAQVQDHLRACYRELVERLG